MGTEQIVVERTDEGEKEKRKKRRPRRSKQNPPVSGAGCNSVDERHGEALDCFGSVSTSDYINVSMGSSSSKQSGLDVHASHDHGMARASNVTFSSMPTMHISDKEAEGSSMQDQDQVPSESGGAWYSKSCSEPILHEGQKGLFPTQGLVTSQKNNGFDDMQKRYFPPYWPVEAVNEALENGDVFMASFRVNAHNRLEAYCTIDGVPTDVLINGVSAQNRAVEGDIVAIKVDPLELWTRLKGSAGLFNNLVPAVDCNSFSKVDELVVDHSKRKNKMVVGCECADSRNGPTLPNRELPCQASAFPGEASCLDLAGPRNCYFGSNGNRSFASDPSKIGYSSDHSDGASVVERLCALISSFPSKRPTGRVVAIVEKSPRRNAVVGFLGVKQLLSFKEGFRKDSKKSKNPIKISNMESIQLTATDPKLPKMTVSLRSLPDDIRKRLMEGDATVEMELVAARIDDWGEENLLPEANVLHVLGRGGEIEPQIAAILFENAIRTVEFSSESLSCLPGVPWEVPQVELESRRDLRSLCTFTIDPSSATDLDDALSVEIISDCIFRVGVHIADVSYFVMPDTDLDIEAQIRSTSVYVLKHKLPMLPSLLSENLGSLIPGVDRLAFSIIWDINFAGEIVDRWIGRTVINSCCKLSYEHAQDIIDGIFYVGNIDTLKNGFPQVHNHFEWPFVIRSVKTLHEISKTLKENRFKDGALWLEGSKLIFLFDESGIPYDSMLCERLESNFLVEEFMLLANKTAAEVISRAFPDCALLRRHPEPNLRRLREFEAFCSKHGLDFDTSSGQFHLSLGRIKEKIKNDPVLFDILISYASKPMQSAAYFCTGDPKYREANWAHYSLAIPLYTHFTSPLRRYPDIVVHRILAAAVDAEEMFLEQQKPLQRKSKRQEMERNSFTGIFFDEVAADSKEGREALSSAALKHKVPCKEVLADVAAYCNGRKLASRHAEDSGEKLYLWVLMKKKETLISEARVLGLGPKFMSLYIHKFAIERRIYYDDVEGMSIEWLEATSTVVLDLSIKKRSQRRGCPAKYRSLEDVAWVISPCDLKQKLNVCGNNIHEGVVGEFMYPEPSSKPCITDIAEIEPAAFPLTVGLLSTIPVVLHAVGGDDGPFDIGTRLYMSSYLW